MTHIFGEPPADSNPLPVYAPNGLIDAVHQRIHDGVFFSYNSYNASIADNGTIVLLLITHATQSAHMRLRASAGGDATFELFEAPTTSANGTEKAPVNRNRTSVKTPKTKVYLTPTSSADGTNLFTGYAPGGSGGFLTGGTPGGDSSVFEEYVLAPGTKYLVRLTNISGGVQPMDITLDFYEP